MLLIDWINFEIVLILYSRHVNKHPIGVVENDGINTRIYWCHLQLDYYLIFTHETKWII